MAIWRAGSLGGCKREKVRGIERKIKDGKEARYKANESRMLTVKEFIAQFDFKNPDWSQVPEGFPRCGLDGLSASEAGTWAAVKTLWELSRPERPSARSRVWRDPEGYRYLAPWSNAVLLRYMVRLVTDELPKSEYRRKAQVDDAARSAVRNMEEGYKRATTSEYLDFLGYSQGSLEEVKGDVREMTEDGFLVSMPGSSLASVGIDLGEFHRALKGDKGGYRKLEGDADSTEGRIGKGSYRTVKGDKDGNKGSARMAEESRGDKGSDRMITDGRGKISEAGEREDDKGGSGKTEIGKDFAYHPITVLYHPLSKIRSKDLTYEVFLELINKTDWLLRKLVQSLEKKQGDEQKWYQVEQARIRDKFKGK